MKNLKKDILSRVYLVYGFICLFALVIIGQTINLQFVKGAELRKKAENLTVDYKSIEAVRGNIYASDGSLLATSIPKYEIRFDAFTDALTDDVFNDKVDSLAIRLSGIFSYKSKTQFKAELKRARKDSARYHLVARNVKYTDLQKVRDFPIFRRGRFKGGFLVEQQNKRVKPFKVLAARTIGYDRVDDENHSVKVGLEGAYSRQLAGVNGKMLKKKISGGVWMPIGDENEVEPLNGSDVYSTIDVNIQDVAENALLSQLKKQGADHGCVVLMEVSTGDVKAIANLKRGKDSTYYESYNYAIGESTEPGSTFKLASLMVAFEDGYLDLDDVVDTEDGTTKFYDHIMRDSHVGGYGKISIKEAFMKSSNVAISKEINRVYEKNNKEFIDALYKMNLNKKLEIEIAGEGAPFIKDTDNEYWSGISIPQMSIGYEVQMTPLQILTFYNAIANDGKMVKPKFVKEIRERGKVVKEFETEVISAAICSEATIEKAKEMLEGVVSKEGTASNLVNPLYSVAGKTGTAQIANDKYGYKYKSKVSHQASFVGYFPADAPKYTCIVVVNAPSKNVYYGNLVAGPIFKEVADKVYANSIEIHNELQEKDCEAKSKIPYAKDGSFSDLKEVYSNLEIDLNSEGSVGNWVVTKTGEKSVEILNKRVPPIYVPDVRGMGIKDAVYILENQGMRVSFSGKGVVKNQSIKAGDKIIKGSKIILELT